MIHTCHMQKKKNCTHFSPPKHAHLRTVHIGAYTYDLTTTPVGTGAGGYLTAKKGA